MTASSFLMTDTRAMLGRQLLHLRRYPSLTAFVVITPIVLLLLFVYVFGGMLGLRAERRGSEQGRIPRLPHAGNAADRGDRGDQRHHHRRGVRHEHGLRDTTSVHGHLAHSRAHRARGRRDGPDDDRRGSGRAGCGAARLPGRDGSTGLAGRAGPARARLVRLHLARRRARDGRRAASRPRATCRCWCCCS